MCSAVLWLLCKILFNNTATEEVLYYLSHCSSLQPQHCISTLLFLHLQAASNSREIPVSATKLNRPQLCHYLTLLGQVLLLQLQRASANCPGRDQMPSLGACTHGRHGPSPVLHTAVRTRGVGCSLTPKSGSWVQQQGCSCSSSSLKSPQGRGAVCHGAMAGPHLSEGAEGTWTL